MAILVNADFENGTGSLVAQGWLGGSSAFGVYYQDANGTLSFETATVKNGLQAIQVAVGGGNAWVSAANGIISTPANIQATCPVVLPSTQYIIGGWQKSSGFTINLSGLSLFITEYDESGTQTASYQSSALSSTQDWTFVSRTWTTQPTTKYLYVQYVRGNGSNGTLYADNFSLERVGGGGFLLNYL